MLTELFKILTVAFFSSFKMILGVPLALTYGYSFIDTVIISSTGGILGVIIYAFFSEWLLKIWKRYFKRKTGKKKIFTRRNKLIVRIKRKYGLVGLAFIAPVLTTPVGTFILIRYFHLTRKVILYESASIIFWSTTTASIRLIFPDFFDYIAIW